MYGWMVPASVARASVRFALETAHHGAGRGLVPVPRGPLPRVGSPKRPQMTWKRMQSDVFLTHLVVHEGRRKGFAKGCLRSQADKQPPRDPAGAALQ